MRRTGRSSLLRGAVLTVAAALIGGCASAEDVLSEPASPSAAAVPSPTPTTPMTEAPSTSPPTAGPAHGLPDGFGPGPSGTGLARFYDQNVTWRDCDDGECADVWVPLDYADPDGRAITLKVKRQPAGDPSRRVGSLLINPGGPGASGVDYVSYAGFDESVTDVYDVVGFDPRGVAGSTPVDCVSDEQMDEWIAADPTPDTPAEVRQLLADWEEFTSGCVARSGPLLAHLSTVEVARDIDVLRGVLGDHKVNWFGASYGTFIGATYAGLFPERVGRMVLDGAVDPLQAPRQRDIDQAAGFETALTAYLEHCIDEGDCPLGDDIDSARDRLIQFFDDLDAQPLPTASGRDVTEGIARVAVSEAMYSPQLWNPLTVTLSRALDGSGEGLLLFADLYSQREPDGSYSGNLLEAFPSVYCLDNPQSETLKDIRRGADDFIKASPVFGRSAAWSPYSCSHWPVAPTESPPDYSAKGAAPIVVAGTTRDPATPYDAAVRLADELDSGVLLSRDGDGHTAYGSGNQCIQDAINTYLATGDPPADGTEC